MTSGLLRRLKVPRAFLSDLVDIEAPTRTPDGQGGFTDSWQTVARNCRTYIANNSPSLGDLAVYGGGLAQRSSHRLWFREKPDGLTALCRVIERSSGRHWRVASIGQYAGSWLVLADEYEAA